MDPAVCYRRVETRVGADLEPEHRSWGLDAIPRKDIVKPDVPPYVFITG